MTSFFTRKFRNGRTFKASHKRTTGISGLTLGRVIMCFIITENVGKGFLIVHLSNRLWIIILERSVIQDTCPEGPQTQENGWIMLQMRVNHKV